MHKELWNVVKNLSNNNESINSFELALANHQLSADVFETMKDHYNKSSEINKRLPPWV